MGIKNKNHDVKERIETVSNKARIAIPIDILMMDQEGNEKEELLATDHSWLLPHQFQQFKYVCGVGRMILHPFVSMLFFG